MARRVAFKSGVQSLVTRFLITVALALALLFASIASQTGRGLALDDFGNGGHGAAPSALDDFGNGGHSASRIGFRATRDLSQL